MSIKIKDPQADLDYEFDWSDWLDPIGDTIASSTVTVPAGLTKGADSNTGTTVTVWLSGGTVGQYYEVVCQITTAQARTDERTMTIFVRNR